MFDGPFVTPFDRPARKAGPGLAARRTFGMINRKAATGLGTLRGGWRIVSSMGPTTARLSPHHEFHAATGGAVAGFPFSPGQRALVSG